jgi:hypothetical protein
MWFTMHCNNLLTCVTTAIGLLHLMTTTIRFYMESGIAKLQLDIHTMYLSISRILFLHSYNDAFI